MAGTTWTRNVSMPMLRATNLVLSKFDTVQKAKLPVDGTVNLVADANGTLTEPGLKANVRLADLVMDGQPLGEVAAEVHSQGKWCIYTPNSTLTGATLEADGTDLA